LRELVADNWQFNNFTLKHNRDQMDMPINRLKLALAAKTRQLGCWLTLESTVATEITAGAGFDWLLLDMEHTGLTLAQVGHHVLAAAGGRAELVVRVPSLDPVLTKNLLDGGVRSLMYPFVQSGEEAARVVAMTRYPPHGVRGVAGWNRANGYNRIPEYGRKYMQSLCVIAQVESPQAFSAVRTMGQVDGLDAIFIGPNDLAANMGCYGQPRHPKVQAAVSAALADIKATGKAAGILNFEPDQAKEHFAAGFDFVAVASDASMLSRRSDELLAGFTLCAAGDCV
jgi:4-hydroxy-2-oxoheptanedioate aldolase